MNEGIQALEKQYCQRITDLEKKLHLLKQTFKAIANDYRVQERQSKEGQIYGGYKFRSLLNESDDRESFRKTINSPSFLLLPEITSSLSQGQRSLIVRTYRRLLVQPGLPTIGDLCRCTEHGLLTYRNVGKKSLRLIKLALEKNGLGLGMEFDPELLDPVLQISTRDLLKGIRLRLKEEIIECLNQWMGGRQRICTPWKSWWLPTLH